MPLHLTNLVDRMQQLTCTYQYIADSWHHKHDFQGTLHWFHILPYSTQC